MAETDGLLRSRHKLGSSDNDNANGNGPTAETEGMCLKESQWRELAETTRVEVVRSLDNHLATALDELMGRTLGDMEDITGRQQADRMVDKMHSPRKNGSDLDSSTAGRARGDQLPDKVFRHRESILTELFRISHIRTVYHIFVAILIIFSLDTMLSDWMDKGGIIQTYHMELVQWVFGNLKDVLMIWVVMQMATILLVYPAFFHWATTRRDSRRWVDVAWLVVYVVYQIGFLVLPLLFIFESDLPPASSCIVVLEQIRMLMKTHAFVRSNIPKSLHKSRASVTRDEQQSSQQTDDTDSNSPCPNFSRYLYFLFAPTLVYRDSYPRTQSIRWGYVVTNFVQVFFCVVYTYYIFARFCFTWFRNFNSTHITARQFILSSFGCMLPGGLVLFITFFAILHSWLNAFAEMLRFGDRLFYKDWWNSTTFSTYYRTWNVVVHDWLYAYVYRDVFALTKGRNRSVAIASVFLLSAVFHEYVLIVAFRFFYPVLFIMFGGAGFGIMFIKGQGRCWNVGLWVALFSGTGILMCLYSMEWYARKNCPPMLDSFFDYLVPRSWFCAAVDV